jgi:hypothetical protein
MQEDQITNSFIESVNRTIVRRNVLLAKTALVLWIFYTLSILWDVYDYLTTEPQGQIMIYYYRVLPIIDVVLLAVNTYGYILIVKGYRSINASFERSDPSLLGVGFKYFYRSNILLIINISASFIVNILKHFL